MKKTIFFIFVLTESYSPHFDFINHTFLHISSVCFGIKQIPQFINTLWF